MDKIDEIHVGQLLYAFSKGNNGFSVGSQEFYHALSPYVNKIWSKIGNLTKSRVSKIINEKIYYAYCNHRVVIDKD